MESFFHTLKNEILKLERLVSHQQVITLVGRYIETFYNLTRRHSAIGFLSPMRYESRNKLR